MSTGHPNRRRGGAPHPRHGPQKQDRPERQPGRNTAALVANSATQADQERPQPKRQPEQSTQAARPSRAVATPASSASAPVVPIARRKGALRTVQSGPSPIGASQANNHADRGSIVEADTLDAPAAQAAPKHTQQQTVVVRAYEAHETHEVHETHEKTHIAHTVHEVYEAHEARHPQTSHEEARAEAHTHTIVADVSAHIVIEHTHDMRDTNGQEPVTETSSEGEPTPATPPRARISRFYAPGGLRFRPDESWVEQAPPLPPRALPEPAPPVHIQAPTPLDDYTEVIERPRPRDELDRLIDSLHTLFEHDRSVASQMGAARCGVCYLHFPLAELEYRESEGFYVCPACQRALGGAYIPMVRRQQK